MTTTTCTIYPSPRGEPPGLAYRWVRRDASGEVTREESGALDRLTDLSALARDLDDGATVRLDGVSAETVGAVLGAAPLGHATQTDLKLAALTLDAAVAGAETDLSAQPSAAAWEALEPGMAERGDR